MRKRYGGLLAATIAVALAVTLWGGPKRRDARIDSARDAGGHAVRVALQIDSAKQVAPASITLRKGDRVTLTVTSAALDPVRIELLGYEDRVPAFVVDPGATWQGGFPADRPGEDFAFLVNGAPAARLIVTGSHLIEGHR